MILPFLPNSHLHLKIAAKQRAEPQHLWSHWPFNLDAVTEFKEPNLWLTAEVPCCSTAAGEGAPLCQPPCWPAQGAGEEEKRVLTSQSYCSHFSLHPTCTERPEKSRTLQQAMGKTRIPAGEGEEGQVVRALSTPRQSEQIADTFSLSLRHLAWCWISWSKYGEDFPPRPLWPVECPQKRTLQYLFSGKTGLTTSQMNRILTTSRERESHSAAALFAILTAHPTPVLLL